MKMHLGRLGPRSKKSLKTREKVAVVIKGRQRGDGLKKGLALLTSCAALDGSDKVGFESPQAEAGQSKYRGKIFSPGVLGKSNHRRG